MVNNKMEKSTYTPKELKAEVARLKALLGDLTTNDQIKAACMERESTDFDRTTNYLKTEAFWGHLRKISALAGIKAEHHRVWNEVTLHDRMGATSQDLADGEVLDADTFLEFGRVVDTWKRLDGDRGTSLLIDCDELVAAKSRVHQGKMSGAKFFRLFLRLEKVKYGINKWNPAAMFELRCRLHKCVIDMKGVRNQTQQKILVNTPLAHLHRADSTSLLKEPLSDVLEHQTGLTLHIFTLDRDTTGSNKIPQKRAFSTGRNPFKEDISICAEQQKSISESHPLIGTASGPYQALAKDSATLTEGDSEPPTREAPRPTELTNAIKIPEVSALADPPIPSTHNTIRIPKHSLNENWYFEVMGRIQQNLEETEEALAASKQAVAAGHAKIDEAKRHHEAVLQSISSQANNSYNLCYQIKEEWPVLSIEAAVTACQNFGETGDAILACFEPIILHEKALTQVHEAEVKCQKLKEDHANMAVVAEIVLEGKRI